MFVPDINWKSYAGQTPFRFWCQTVLPLVYEESLSYYELLCKVVNYLNNLLKDLNGVADNVLELNKGYEQLVNYINNYFENLNVQEEINNKLDEMAEDGTLTNLFSSYMLKKFDTAEEMAADTTLVLGGYCQTLGFHSTGDKLGCKYRITDSVDLAPASIKLDNGYYAFPIENDFKTGYVYWDSEHNVDGIEGILEFALNNYENITITEDEYEITRTIEVNKNGETLKTINLYIDDKADIDVTINYEEDSTDTSLEHIAIGFYIENCILKINGGQFTYTALDSSDQKVKLWYQHNSKCSLFYIYDCPYADIKNININSLYCGRGINIVSCDDIKIDNIHIDGKGTYTDANWHNFAGVTVGDYFVSFSATNCNIKNIRNQSTETSKYSYGIATGFTSYQIETPLCGSFYVGNCRFENCYWEGADTHGSELSTITNCYFHNCFRFGALYHDGRVKWTNSGGVATFSNNYCVNDSGFNSGAIFASATSNGFQYDMFVVENCYFQTKIGETNTHHLQNVVYKNCIFDMLNSTGQLMACSHGNITFENVRFRNTDRNLGFIQINGSSVTAKNTFYESIISGVKLYSAFNTDRYSYIDWDKAGASYTTYSGINGYRGLFELSSRLVKIGDLITTGTGSNNQLNINAVASTIDNADLTGMRGFGRYAYGYTENYTEMTEFASGNSKYIIVTPWLENDNTTIHKEGTVVFDALKRLSDLHISAQMCVSIQHRDSDGVGIIDTYNDIISCIVASSRAYNIPDNKTQNYQIIYVYFNKELPARISNSRYYIKVNSCTPKLFTFEA